MKNPLTSDIELTLREEGWLPAEAVLQLPMSPICAAWKLLDEDSWSRFCDNVTSNAGFRFFNGGAEHISQAVSWEALAEEEGIKPYSSAWRVHPSLSANAKAFCRDLRALFRWEAEHPEPEPSYTLFIPTHEWNRVSQTYDRLCAPDTEFIIRMHDSIAPYLNASIGDTAKHRWATNSLLARGLKAGPVVDGFVVVRRLHTAEWHPLPGEVLT